MPPAAPQRIIALAPSTAEIVWALGAGDRLVAVGRYCVYPAELERLPKIGGVRDPDLETVLSLQPDLVLVRGRTDALDQLCRARQIRLYYDPTETLADIARAVREIGSLLGRAPQAEVVIAEMEQGLARVRQAVEGRPRPRVLFTSRQPDQLAEIYTVAKGSYLDELITLAGGTNIFGDQDIAYPLVSLEEILARRPEVIVESLFGETDRPGLRESVIAQWRAVGPIPAVESGRVHLVTADYATVPSPRVVQMAADLAQMFHPEVSLERY